MSFWKTFFVTFGAVFVAELGDKTQLMTLSLTVGSSAKWAVFAGSAAALTATAAIAVVAGDLISRTVPTVWLERGAGVLMLILGGVLLWRAR